MKTVDLVIIGGGSAGMAAAIQAYDEGVRDILILEKDGNLGGILNQCIHNGFGLTEFKEELTGPEYLSRFVNQVEERKIPYKLNSMVLTINKKKEITYSNSVDGIQKITAKAIVFATGCYERTAGAIQIPGDRVNGIITAGTAQKYLNIHGYLVGKRVVILGSGDIGLIMARRMTLEGAKVLAVAELMPYSNGLQRNISQCLNDFNIPLYLSHSVSKVIGKENVEKVIIQKVDENKQFIPGTEIEFDCDTLLLSVGLIPYVSLLKTIGTKFSQTKGPIVYENMETSNEGIFACGNCLHVHDVVDFVTEEGRNAGHGAAQYLNDLIKTNSINVKNLDNVSYVVPQMIKTPIDENVTLKFRVRKVMKNVKVIVKSKDDIIAKQIKIAVQPSEMIMINIKKEKLENIKNDIEVMVVSNE